MHVVGHQQRRRVDGSQADSPHSVSGGQALGSAVRRHIRFKTDL
jgi:hypothetical protein